MCHHKSANVVYSVICYACLACTGVWFNVMRRLLFCDLIFTLSIHIKTATVLVTFGSRRTRIQLLLLRFRGSLPTNLIVVNCRINSCSRRLTMAPLESGSLTRSLNWWSLKIERSLIHTYVLSRYRPSILRQSYLLRLPKLSRFTVKIVQYISYCHRHVSC
jgi:hypothetical protein